MSSKRFPEAPGYKIIREIGSGGMGDVFLARDATGDEVAIKYISGLTGAAIDRFRRETAAMRSIRSRFIVQYLEESFDGEHPFVVYEFASGEPLNEFVARQGPLNEAQLREFAIGIGDLLHGMQESGIAHRDLKPSNVIITEDGPRVIDFGISSIEGATPLTTRFVPGTPDWMAPEVRNGNAVVTEKIDIYGFGLLIGFAATGIPPDIDASRYRNLKSQAGPELAALVNRCLSLNPTDRPDATTILWACVGLDPERGLTFLRGAPTTPQRTIDRRSRRSRRRRVVLMLAIVAALMLTSSASTLIWSGYDFSKMSISSTGSSQADDSDGLPSSDTTMNTSTSTSSSSSTSTTATPLKTRTSTPSTSYLQSKTDSSTIISFNSGSIPSSVYGEFPILEAVNALPLGVNALTASALKSGLEIEGFVVDAAFISNNATVASFRIPGRSSSCFMIALTRTGSSTTNIRLAEKLSGGCSQRETSEWWT